MKKFIFLCSIVYIFLSSINSVSAQEYLKNFYIYEVKNVKANEFGSTVKKTNDSIASSEKLTTIKNVENTYIYTSNDLIYFVRIYPANKNTNIFVVANEQYDVDNNDITKFLQKSGHQYSQLKDKNALEEYQFDFYTLARQENLDDFFVVPDLAKPLKTGISKINNKMSKYTQKTPTLPYSNDSSPINLTCVDTANYYDNNANISLVRKEYRLKEKTKRYLSAFEYVLTNKNNSEVSVTVTNEKPVNLVDVTTETMANMDRMDFMDMTCSFPPVVICTAGLSLVGSIPNWIRWGKLTKEATRYSHSLPENYKLKPQNTMHVLVLKSKKDPKPLNFKINFQNQSYDISF